MIGNCWTISPEIKGKLEAAETSFHRRMLRMQRKEHAGHDKILWKMERKMNLYSVSERAERSGTRNLENLTHAKPLKARRAKRSRK